jgi:hypothetical protein
MAIFTSHLSLCQNIKFVEFQTQGSCFDLSFVTNSLCLRLVIKGGGYDLVKKVKNVRILPMLGGNERVHWNLVTSKRCI